MPAEMRISDLRIFRIWRRIGSYFFPAKNIGRWRGCPYQALNARPFVTFTAHAAARLKASGMAITATVPEPRPTSSFGASSNR
jgi:hypothetical protein